MMCIVLFDKPEGMYRSGDKIKGEIQYSPLFKFSLNHVDIYFRGYSTVHSYHNYLPSTSHLLFSYPLRVYSSDSKFLSGRQRWPFEFTFPFTSVSVQGQNLAYDANFGPVGQTLPPTFTEPEPYHEGPSFGVAYELRVYPTQFGRCVGSTGHPEFLSYEPLSPPGMIRCQMGHCEGNFSPAISRTSKLLGTTNQSTSGSELQVSLEVPKLIASGEIFPATLAVTPRTWATKITNMKIKSFSISIHWHAIGRHPGYAPVRHNGSYEAMLVTDLDITNSDLVDLTRPNKQSRVVYYPNQFKDQAMSTWYTISVDGIILCMDTKYEVKFSKLPLDIIPPVPDKTYTPNEIFHAF